MLSQSASISLINNAWKLYSPGQTITYSFLDGVPSNYPPNFYQGRYLNGFTPFAPAQRAALRKILDLIENATSLRFQEASAGNVADIRFGNTSQPSSGGVNIPFTPSQTGTLRPINDIYMSNRPGNDATGTALGGYGFTTLIHEVGHALGLKHPFEAPAADATLTKRDTVMAYRDDTSYPDAYAITPLLLDIAALQAMYGSNPSFATGNSDYVFERALNADLGAFVFNRIFSEERRTIWDSSGTDKLDASKHDERVILTLIEGDYSSVGGLFDNFSIAFGTKIENATGGNGNDQITGNALGNTLSGGNGESPTGDGNDLLKGGAGADTYTFAKNFGNDTIVDTDGKIQIDGANVTGGNKVTENFWHSEDKKYLFTRMGGDLIIKRRSEYEVPLDSITVRNWSPGQLGINLEGEVPALPDLADKYIGDEHGPIRTRPDGTEYYDWSLSFWESDGMLSNAEVQANYGDVIRASAAASKVQGLGGHDAIDGGAGEDQLDGGEGDDLIGGGIGSDNILGGAGSDTILSATGLTVTQRVAPDDEFAVPANAEVHARGPKWAVYNVGPDLVIAGGGSIPTDDDDDIVDGGAGNDFIFTGLGDDAIVGGEGDDYVEGHGGDDIIDGDAGDDVLQGDGYTLADYGYRTVTADKHGADLIDGGDGSDKIIGGGSADVLYGGADDDTIVGDTNGDAQNEPGWISGEYHGDDYIDGEDGNDTLAGDGGDDTLYGGSGNDELQGDRAVDQVSGDFHGKDYLDGEEGDDTLIGGGKDDVLYGSEGNDTLVGDGEPSLIGDDYLDGGEGDDKLWGGRGDDILIGGDGADELDGGDGNDFYEAGAGDSIFDSGGNNTITYAGDLPGTVNVNGHDLFLGFDTGGPQTMRGMQTMSENAVPGVNGLVIEGAFLGGQFSLNNADLDDEFFDGYDVSLVTTAEDQILSTWAGNDTLTAEHDNANLDGKAGNDVLTGSSGTNTLWGGDGDDTLISRGLKDTLHGAEGNDTFRIESDDGEATIAADLQLGQDTVVFAGSSATTVLTGRVIDEDVLITSTRSVTDEEGAVTQEEGPTLWLKQYFKAGGQTASNSITGITFDDGVQISLAQLLATDTAGGATEDTLYGGLFGDNIDGGGGNDEIHAESGNDHLVGGDGNDALYGDSGKDTLEGGEGNDVLRGGYGSDILRGGAGNDTYVFGDEVDPSVVGDQEAGQQVDVIEDSEGANIIALGDGATLDSVSFVKTSDSVSSLFFGNQRIEIHGATSGFMVQVDGFTRTLESFTEAIEPPPVDGSLTPAQRAFLVSREADAAARVRNAVATGRFSENTDSTSSRWKQVNSNAASVGPVALTFRGYVESEHQAVVGFTDSAGNPVSSNQVSGLYTGVLSSVTSFRPLQDALRAQGRNVTVTSMSPGLVGFEPHDEQSSGEYHWRVLGWHWSGIDKSLTERYGTVTYSDYVVHKDAHAANVVLGEADNRLEVGASIVHAGSGNDMIRVGDDWLYTALQYGGRGVESFLGAAASFVDGGDGDDTIYASDLDDVLVGGRGRDLLAGNTGSDRYLVLDYGQSSDDEDVISDTAVSGREIPEVGGWVYYGAGVYDQDTVEFGPGIALADLYFVRETFEREYEAPGEMLVVVRDGRRLASIEVGDSQLQGSGVERLQFADGTGISFDEALARAQVAVPLTVGATTDAQLLEDGDFNYSVAGLFGGGTGAITYTAKLDDGSALPGWLAFDRATGAFSGTLVNEPAASFTVKVTASDRAGATGSASFSVAIESTNDAPAVGITASDVAAFQDHPFSLQLGEDLFTDADAGDSLSWWVQLSDGRALPSWLGFDQVTRTLAGTPLNADSGVLTLQIVVTDSTGITGTQEFRLSVSEIEGLEVIGTPGMDNLGGGAGDDRIDGLGRADVMAGGDGDDVYVVDNTQDSVVEWWGQGYDRVEAHVSYTLPGEVEAITLKGTRNLAAIGNWLDNELVGNSGSNVLIGGEGNDRMIGGAGNDTYSVDSGGDQVIELAGGGTDLVETTVNYTLGVDLERLTLVAPGLVGTGNELANQMIISVDGGGTLYGLGGNDTLWGGAGADTLFGGEGNDRLNGRGGADQLEGGAGNDVYVVNDQSVQIVEFEGEGTDTVQSSVNFGLAQYVENLTFTGTEGRVGWGNDGANTMVGTSGADIFYAAGGNDRLQGRAGEDALYGGEGNDRLDGGTGADVMVGEFGNDTYVVDEAGDVVEEYENEGTDTVQTSIDFVLGANVENLTFTGAGLLTGTGNELNNVMSANAAGSTLHGLAGNDTLKGGAAHDVLNGGEGNDRYLAVDLADDIVELADEGTDTVQTALTYTLGANVENLTLTGTASVQGTGNDLANVIVANATGSHLAGLAGNDTLRGAASADVIIGGAGNDRLEGGLGGDLYKFGRGDGQDTIVENDATADVIDTLQFDAGIDASQLWWRKTGNNLEVSVIGSGDKVTLSNWYLGAARHVEVFELSNGQQLLDAQVQALVEAMASFAPPGAGQTTLPPNYQDSLGGVLAANWQ